MAMTIVMRSNLSMTGREPYHLTEDHPWRPDCRSSHCQPATLLQTANGYLLCEPHGQRWRAGGNDVAMRPVAPDDVADHIPFECVDCADGEPIR